ncbi:MAG: TRAP transporter substrate-binding protein [candidate division NC10 bacterium]|nr:TRAP transporter substrate-binding protein [candidate division NC10 bacterium]
MHGHWKAVGAALLALTLFMAGAGIANAAEVVIRLGSEEPFKTPPGIAAQYGLEFLAQELPKRTGGKVSSSNAAPLVKEAGFLAAAYLFESYAQAERALITDPRLFTRLQQLVKEKKQGFELVGLALTGTRNLYNRVKPVKNPDDLKGMKMRVMANPTEFKVWSTLGTLPTNIPAPEIYTSLQTGVVDAAESSLPAIVTGKYYEVAPHVVLTHHQYNVHMYFLSDRTLAKIPADLQKVVLDTFREAGAVQLKAAIKLADEKLAELKSKPGVTVTEVDTKAFASKLRDVQDEVAKELGVQDLLKLIRELR